MGRSLLAVVAGDPTTNAASSRPARPRRYVPSRALPTCRSALAHTGVDGTFGRVIRCASRPYPSQPPSLDYATPCGQRSRSRSLAQLATRLLRDAGYPAIAVADARHYRRLRRARRGVDERRAADDWHGVCDRLREQLVEKPRSNGWLATSCGISSWMRTSPRRTTATAPELPSSATTRNPRDSWPYSPTSRGSIRMSPTWVAFHSPFLTDTRLERLTCLDRLGVAVELQDVLRDVQIRERVGLELNRRLPRRFGHDGPPGHTELGSTTSSSTSSGKTVTPSVCQPVPRSASCSTADLRSASVRTASDEEPTMLPSAEPSVEVIAAAASPNKRHQEAQQH